MIGSEFRPTARALDWAEVKARAIMDWAKRVWDRSPLVAKVLLVLVGVAFVAGAAYGGYALFVD